MFGVQGLGMCCSLWVWGTGTCGGIWKSWGSFGFLVGVGGLASCLEEFGVRESCTAEPAQFNGP